MTLRILILCAILLAISACGDKAQDVPAPSVEPKSPAETAALPRTASAEGASVYFITPESGATVANPIRIEFGIAGMAVVKAGDPRPESGHHHLLIDSDLPDLGIPIPADEHHIHFGDGSTATELSLQPGEHMLQLILGDHLHIPHEPPVISEPIMITVE